jgi:hypothetical protein
MPFFMRQPHRSRRDPYARERSRRSTVWFNFVPIWIHSARGRGINSSSHGCHNWHCTDYPTEIASNYRGKSSIRCGYSLTTEFFWQKLRSYPPTKPRNELRHACISSGLSVLSGRLATGARDKHRTKERGRQRARIQSRFRLGSSETREIFSFI